MKLSKFIPVAFVLAIIFSCKKDNNGSAPTEQAYLPATFKLTVSDGSFANFELTYNDDNSVATLTSSMLTSEGEIDTAHFSHNANGDCVKVTFTNNMGLVGGVTHSYTGMER